MLPIELLPDSSPRLTLSAGPLAGIELLGDTSGNALAPLHAPLDSLIQPLLHFRSHLPPTSMFLLSAGTWYFALLSGRFHVTPFLLSSLSPPLPTQLSFGALALHGKFSCTALSTFALRPEGVSRRQNTASQNMALCFRTALCPASFAHTTLRKAVTLR